VGVDRSVIVACVQAEPVILDLDGTLDRVESLAAEAAGNGAELVVFPETFVPIYPSSRWAKAFAGWDNAAAQETFARIAQNSVAVGSAAERRLGATAEELGIWLVTGVNEVEPERPGTIYNSLLYHAPDGTLALHHRKLVPTNHERLIHGQGDGRGLTAVETGFGRRGGSAILAPDGSYLAGPVYDEEQILYAELDPTRLLAARQRFDPTGHYHRPDVLGLSVSPAARAGDVTSSTRPSVRSSRP